MGDEQWFVELYALRYGQVLAFAARRVGVDAAADVAAETFLVAWRRRDDARRIDLPWLLVTARNLISNSVRSSTRRTALGMKLATIAGAYVPDTAAVDDVLDVRRALASMPSSHTEALLLTEWEQLSVQDAAAVAQCSEGAFRVRLHRARRHLAALLEPERRTPPTGALVRATTSVPSIEGRSS